MANVQLLANDIMGAQANEDAPINLSMEAHLYEEKLIKVRTLVEIAKVGIHDYMPSDVEIHDVKDGEYRRLLEGTYAKYEQAQAEICDVLARLKDSDVDKERTQNLYSLQKDLQKNLQTKWRMR